MKQYEAGFFKRCRKCQKNYNSYLITCPHCKSFTTSPIISSIPENITPSARIPTTFSNPIITNPPPVGGSNMFFPARKVDPLINFSTALPISPNTALPFRNYEMITCQRCGKSNLKPTCFSCGQSLVAPSITINSSDDSWAWGLLWYLAFLLFILFVGGWALVFLFLFLKEALQELMIMVDETMAWLAAGVAGIVLSFIAGVIITILASLTAQFLEFLIKWLLNRKS